MDQSSRRRAAVFNVVVFALLFALVVRLYCIQVLGHDEYLSKREGQITGRVPGEKFRGNIKDRNDQVLALSVPMETVWANPSALGEQQPAASRLIAGALGMRDSEVLARLTSSPSKKFVYIKHKVAPEQAAAVRKLMNDPLFKTGGRDKERKLGLETEYQRVYPQGSLFAQGVGFMSADDGRDEALERWLASLLQTSSRSVPIVHDGRQDRLGAAGPSMVSVEATLTVNLLLQKVLEDKLEAACAEYHPKWAVGLIMNPKTGEILALANRPTFDPNHPGSASAEARLNRVVSAPIEPGSTLKPFTSAYALDLGLLHPDTKIDCENGVWKHGPRLLHDHHPYASITLAEVIKYSSNIGAAKVGALILGQRRLYECMHRWGFGERTQVDLPAEDPGLLFPLSRWTIYSETSVPMGHEISVTPLQLTTAMCAIANGGTLYRPYVVSRVVASDGTVLVDNGPQVVRQVIGSKASKEMIEILKGVVEDGTGKKAAVQGVKVAGKTGTSQKIDPKTKQYTHEKYIASFVGFAPADDAKLCVAVILDEPQGGSYYGGAVAAPVVGKIIQDGLIYAK